MYINVNKGALKVEDCAVAAVACDDVEALIDAVENGKSLSYFVDVDMFADSCADCLCPDLAQYHAALRYIQRLLSAYSRESVLLINQCIEDGHSDLEFGL